MKDHFVPPFSVLLHSFCVLFSWSSPTFSISTSYIIIIILLLPLWLPEGKPGRRHFCKGICPGTPWCGAATSQLTQCILSVPRQFVHQHFLYETSSTDISSTDIWYTTAL